MTEESIDTPAGAGTQEAPNPEPKQELKAEPTLREKAFGGKIKPKPEEPKKEPDAPGTLAESSALNGELPKKKGAKEQIQKYAREKNEWKAKAEAKAAEIESLQAELKGLREIADTDKTARDQYREALIEDKLSESMRAIQTELQDYADRHENPEMFETSYNYYMPAFQKSDPWTIGQISKFPEKIEMFDKLFQAITAGVFTQQQWFEAPQPVKMQKIADLRKLVLGAVKPAQSEPKKDMPDSVVPDLNPRHQPDKPAGKGATFYKVFNSRKRSG